MARCIVAYAANEHPPLLTLYIHDAPHRRMHLKVIQAYREDLRASCTKAGLPTPIDHPIDLSVVFINPSSPDLDNLVTALYQAIDGNTLRGPGVLADDGLIHKVTMSKFFPGPKKK